MMLMIRPSLIHEPGLPGFLRSGTGLCSRKSASVWHHCALVIKDLPLASLKLCYSFYTEDLNELLGRSRLLAHGHGNGGAGVNDLEPCSEP